MSPRNTGMKGDITGTGVKDLAPLRGPTKASTMAAVAQGMAGIGADSTPDPHVCSVTSTDSINTKQTD